jgi:hypothetical protein
VDIAKISLLCEHEFVVGDVMKAIDEIYSSGFTGFMTNTQKRILKAIKGKKDQTN